LELIKSLPEKLLHALYFAVISIYEANFFVEMTDNIKMTPFLDVYGKNIPLKK